MTLPRREDFPFNSFLDQQKAKPELVRVKAIPLAMESDLASERELYSHCLATAVAARLGVVGFYY